MDITSLKETIIAYNGLLGIETVFFNDTNGIQGYKQGRAVYLNENCDEEMLKKINRHEVLHFYENSKIFTNVKHIVFKLFGKEKMKSLIDEYYDVYKDLYTKEEVKQGVLINEIVIDVLTGEIKTDLDIDKMYKLIIQNEKVEVNDNKRYLNLSLSKQLRQQYSKLSDWDKIFVANYYDSKNKIVSKDNKYEQINKDIERELERLYLFAQDEKNFVIATKNNEFLEREFDNEIKTMSERGEVYAARVSLLNKDKLLVSMAERFSKMLQEEFSHLVDVIRYCDYDSSFKYLMLNETLTKIYKVEKGKIYVSNRILDKSISGHMVYNQEILDYIYKGFSRYDNFAKLYFDSLEGNVFKVLNDNNIDIEGVDTFNKGKWLKFEGKPTNPKEYSQNAEKLKVLIANTNWCTRYLASQHLQQGDFYVFVDNDNKPHLAVKMFKKSIDEVRGILDNQRIEKEYEDVIDEFLVKNKDIDNGDRWLENQKWNQNLQMYIDLIEIGVVLDENQLNLMGETLNYKEYKSHGGINNNKQKLIKLIIKHEYIKTYFEVHGYWSYELDRNHKCLVIIDNLEKYIDLAKKGYEFNDDELKEISMLYKENIYDYGMEESKEKKVVLAEELIKYPNILNYFKGEEHEKIYKYLKDALMLMNIDEIDDCNKLVELLNYLYSYDTPDNKYPFINREIPRIYTMYNGEKIAKKLSCEKYLTMLSQKFNCSKEDILFLSNTLHIDSSNDFYNKYIFGHVFLGRDRVCANYSFNAKMVVGKLSFAHPNSNIIECPNLMYVNHLDLLSVLCFNAPRLTKCESVSIKESKKVVLDGLICAKSLHCLKTKRLECSALTCVEKMELENNKEIVVPKLTNVANLKIKDTTRLVMPGLIKVVNVDMDRVEEFVAEFLNQIKGELDIKGGYSISMPNLKKAKNISVKKCDFLDIRGIEEIENDLLMRQTNFVLGTPKLETIGGNGELVGVGRLDLSSLKHVDRYLGLVHVDYYNLPKEAEVINKIIWHKKTLAASKK